MDISALQTSAGRRDRQVTGDDGRQTKSPVLAPLANVHGYCVSTIMNRLWPYIANRSTFAH